jgi:dienelactone hydrolase
MNITIKGNIEYVDERLNFIISDLKPEIECKIELNILYSWDDTPCLSYGVYRADQYGVVNLAETGPLSGSYKGIDSMGLFATCKEIRPIVRPRHERDFTKEFVDCRLCVICGSEKVEKKFIRFFTSKKIMYKRVSVPITGHYFYHANNKNTNPILLLGGSEGVANPMLPTAACLANKGFNVFCLQYFSPARDPLPVKELPVFLRLIPIEYINKGIDWLCEISGSNQVFIMGFSRGAELALLISTLNEKVKKVVAISPSAYVWQGIYTISSAWSFKKKAIPCLIVIPIFGFIDMVKNTIMGLFGLPQGYYFSYEMSRRILPNKYKERARIKIEETEATILLVAGSHDCVWNSKVAVNIIIDAMDSHNKGENIFCKVYEKAGHFYLPPFIFGEDVIGGENKIKLSNINEDFWESTIKFFDN